MIFYKTSSFGNDFIEVEAEELSPGADRGALVRAICDRQRGVGADGVVFYRADRKAAVPLGDRAPGKRWHFEIFNCDGGVAELSGNGMAGLAAVLLQRRLARSPLALHAAIGSRCIVLIKRQGPLFQLDVEIGMPDFACRDFFPFLRAKQNSYCAAGVKFHPVSVGNPHAVVICRELPPAARLQEIGKKLEGHPMFPSRVNVEFVQPRGRDCCRVFFYERGVGPTLASSTGSAAVFAVLRRLGLAGDGLTIECEAASAAEVPEGGGGAEPLRVDWRSGIHVRNFTRLVCRGEYFL